MLCAVGMLLSGCPLTVASGDASESCVFVNGNSLLWTCGKYRRGVCRLNGLPPAAAGLSAGEDVLMVLASVDKMVVDDSSPFTGVTAAEDLNSDFECVAGRDLRSS